MLQAIPSHEYYAQMERDLLNSGNSAYLTFDELEKQQDTHRAEAGYKTYTGHILTQAEADALNRYTEELNRTRTIKTREYLKDVRHKMFCMITQSTMTKH